MDSGPSAGTNPSDATEQNMKEKEEPFDPKELVPPSLDLLEMVQPVDHIFGLPANGDSNVENTNHGSSAKEGVRVHTNSGLTG